MIKPGETRQTVWQVTVPGSATPAAYPLSARATFQDVNGGGLATADGGISVPSSGLSAVFDNTGISDDSDIFTANFDGVGNSYSAQTLTAAGLAPGATVIHDGITFTWPDIQPGRPDNVIAQGQTIQLSGSGTTLGVLGAGSPANESGSGTVYYTDGTTSSFSITLDNYFNPPVGNDAIATLPYLNDTNPATAGGKPGQRQHTVYVFYTSAPLTAGKTVRAITLPTGGTIPASGRITGMHIALAIGSP